LTDIKDAHICRLQLINFPLVHLFIPFCFVSIQLHTSYLSSYGILSVFDLHPIMNPYVHPSSATPIRGPTPLIRGPTPNRVLTTTLPPEPSWEAITSGLEVAYWRRKCHEAGILLLGPMDTSPLWERSDRLERQVSHFCWSDRKVAALYKKFYYDNINHKCTICKLVNFHFPNKLHASPDGIQAPVCYPCNINATSTVPLTKRYNGAHKWNPVE